MIYFLISSFVGLAGEDGVPGHDAEDVEAQQQDFGTCFPCPPGPPDTFCLKPCNRYCLRPVGRRGLPGARGARGFPGMRGIDARDGNQGKSIHEFMNKSDSCIFFYS